MMNIILDLDGTLIDPEAGICGSVAYAFQQMGLPVPAASVLRGFIGPPLSASFQATMPEAIATDIERAIALYRERFAAVGVFENRVYPAIPEVLVSLRASGHQLLVATSKPWIFAEQILDHFELSPFFDAIYGSELNGQRSHKADLLAFVLQQQELSADHCLMVGDRSYDVAGAMANGIPAVGVSWGYGTREELAAAEAILDEPAELLGFIQGRQK